MSTVTARELRRTLSDILGRVSHGKERVTVTRNGKPCAVLVPVEDAAALEALEDRIDLEDARKRMKEKGSIPLAKVMKDLGIVRVGHRGDVHRGR